LHTLGGLLNIYIKSGEITPQPQVGGGLHHKREGIKFEPFIKEKGWNTLIRELKEQYNRRKDKP